MLYHGTDVDGPDLEPERLGVRGQDLNAIVGRCSYTAAIHHVVFGFEPDAHREALLDRYLNRALLALSAAEVDSPVALVVQLVAKSGASPSRAVMAGLAVDHQPILSRLLATAPAEEHAFPPEIAEGLYYLAIAPLLATWSVGLGAGAALDADGDTDYLANVFSVVAPRSFRDTTERAVFDAVLVSLHAGFGIFTPSCRAPRTAASTGAPMPQALAAGFAASGPAHVGACELARELIAQIAGAGAGHIEEAARHAVEELLNRGCRVPGFGHPLFEADPRPPYLRKFIANQGYWSIHLEVYDTLCELLASRRLNPNIDSLSAAVFLSLGIPPGCGTGLFLCSRAGAMIAHILEMRNRPEFGLNSRLARALLALTPKDRPTILSI